MKVQAKLLSDHYQYEVVEESSNYYIVYGTGGKVAVSKADYEPVQEWVDVTHECCAVNAQLRHGSLDVHASAWFGNGHYRLRKIDATVHGFPHPAYFIVERKDKA